MTKFAIDLAREALQQRCGGGTEFHSDGAISIAYRFPSRQVADQFQNALAALTVEPVPPDREMVAKKLETATASYDEMREAAAIIRQPAPAELEAMAKRLDAFAKWAPVAEEAAALFRRFILPAVGDWRKVQRSEKPTIAELEAILASDHHEVRIDPDGSVWERSKPAPPIPEEPSR